MCVRVCAHACVCLCAGLNMFVWVCVNATAVLACWKGFHRLPPSHTQTVPCKGTGLLVRVYEQACLLPDEVSEVR